MDQGSTMKRSAVHNFAPTVTKFCVMWEGQALLHDTKFGNSRCDIVGRRVIFIWSLIHGLRWSGLIKAEPGPLLIQIMAFHLFSVPSHYLNQCWHIVNWTNLSEMPITIQTFSLKKMHLKVLFAIWWPSCLALNVREMHYQCFSPF